MHPKGRIRVCCYKYLYTQRARVGQTRHAEKLKKPRDLAALSFLN